MNEQYDTFTLERTYPASPGRVFAAFSTPEGKARWFAGPTGWDEHQRAFDFRVGGNEKLVGKHGDGTVSSFDCTYHDIVADRRIVYSYAMELDGKRISVSLATITFTPDGAGTRLTLTEQGVYLDGYDDAGSREHGTGVLLDQLGASLATAGAHA